LLAEGKTMKETGQILSITPRTVAFHKYRIMETLGFENSSQLIRFAMKSGLFES
jgi:DNA-binding CsgD family transcriptional regulator